MVTAVSNGKMRAVCCGRQRACGRGEEEEDRGITAGQFYKTLNILHAGEHLATSASLAAPPGGVLLEDQLCSGRGNGGSTYMHLVVGGALACQIVVVCFRSLGVD